MDARIKFSYILLHSQTFEVKNGFSGCRSTASFFIKDKIFGRTGCVYSKLKSALHERGHKLTTRQLNFFSLIEK